MSRMYRARPRHALPRPLSLAQKRALVALVRACPDMGDEAEAAVVARVSGLKPNAAVLALDGLVRRKLAVRHTDPVAWSPTMSGRGMAKYVRAAEPRSRPVTESRKRDE
jgi:DNA-binding MarR family transcriptional regulator